MLCHTMMQLRSVCLSVHQIRSKTGEGMKTEKVPWDVGLVWGMRGEGKEGDAKKDALSDCSAI